AEKSNREATPLVQASLKATAIPAPVSPPVSPPALTASTVPSSQAAHSDPKPAPPAASVAPADSVTPPQAVALQAAVAPPNAPPFRELPSPFHDCPKPVPQGPVPVATVQKLSPPPSLPRPLAPPPVQGDARVTTGVVCIEEEPVSKPSVSSPEQVQTAM